MTKDEEDEDAWRRGNDGTTSLALMRAIQLPQCTSNTISPYQPPPKPSTYHQHVRNANSRMASACVLPRVRRR